MGGDATEHTGNHEHRRGHYNTYDGFDPGDYADDKSEKQCCHRNKNGLHHPVVTAEPATDRDTQGTTGEGNAEDE